MKKHVSSKKALLASIMSLVLCCAMLLGTTFAWFTDSVTSGTNRIQAGNLDVEMYYRNSKTANEDGDWSTVATEATDPEFFKDKDGGDILWEPGVASFAQFKVKNLGSLALKYLFQMAVQSRNYTADGKSLTDVLKVAVLDGAVIPTDAQVTSASQSFDAFKDNAALAAGAEKAFTVVVYWEPTANDNDYNVNNGGQALESDGTPSDVNRLYINIDIQLNATQMTAESDSYGPLYDADAEVTGISLPTIVNFTVAKTVEVNTVEKTVTAPVTLANSGTTVEAVVPAGVKMTAAAAAVPDPVLTLVVENEDPADAGIVITPLDAVNNAVVGYNISIPEVAPDNTEPITANVYFGKGLSVANVYHKGEAMAAETWSYSPITGYVTLTTTSFSNFAFEYFACAATIGEQGYATLQKAFDAAKQNDVITLANDITLTTQVTIENQAVLNGITLDGADHTIRLATSADPSRPGGSGLYFGNNSQSKWCTGVTIRNLKMTGMARFAIFLCGGTTSVLENVDISGSYLYALNLYGTHGATMVNCHISNDLDLGTDNEFGSSVWSNVASAFPLQLTAGSTIDRIGINQYTSANTKGPKIYIDATSSVDTVYSYEDGADGDALKLCLNDADEGRVTNFYYIKNGEALKVN